MSLTAAAVIFDLDGTLIDSLADLGESMNTVLSARGFPTHPLERYKRFVGDGMVNLVRRALPQIPQEARTVEACVGEMRTVYRGRWDQKTRLYPGIAELLDALVRRRLPLAVLSNKPDDSARLAVERLLAPWRFALVVGTRPGLPQKPDPAGARLIARELEIDPAHVVYLGDTDTDMRTAVAAGMYAVGAAWGFRTVEELMATGARALVKQPLELLDVVDAPLPSHGSYPP